MPPSLHEHQNSEPNHLEPESDAYTERESVTALTSCRRATAEAAGTATRSALRRRMSVASSAKTEDAGSGGSGLGFYPEIEARRRGHPRRARECERGRDLGVDVWMGMNDELTTTRRGWRE